MSDVTVLLFFRDVKRGIAPYVAVTGVLCNALLLWLIITRSTKTMKDYKKVLMLTCITELLFSATLFVFTVTLTVQDGTYFCIIEGALGHLPPFWTYVGFDLVLLFAYAGVTNNAAVYFYRFLAVCCSKKLNACLFMCCVVAGWSFNLFYVFSVTYQFIVEPVDPLIHEKLTAAGFPSNESFHNFISCPVVKFAGYSMFAAFPFTTIVCIAVVAMSFAVQHKFKQLNALFSSSERRVHSEMTAILWIEAITPFITVVLPIYFDISKLLIPGLPIWFGELIWVLTLIGPTFTALFKICSIKAFRGALYRLVYKSWHNNKTMVVSISLTTVLRR